MDDDYDGDDASRSSVKEGDECIFCLIVEGKRDAAVVYEDDAMMGYEQDRQSLFIGRRSFACAMPGSTTAPLCEISSTLPAAMSA